MSGITSWEGAWVEPYSKRHLGYRFWRPSSVHRLVVMIHGFGEHGGRYEEFARGLAEEGIAVGAADLLGHGRSDGRRGDVERIDDYVKHTEAIAREVFLPESGQARYVLFGHSFGGLAAILLAMTSPPDLQAVVVQSPLLEAGFPIPRWKTVAAAWLAGWWPTYSFSMNLDTSALSHDPRVVEAYRADPLVHNVMSARTYGAIFRARDAALEGAARLRVPVLLLSAAEDRIVSLEASQRWFERLRCEKRFVLFPGSYHELHHEAARDEVVRLVREWALAHG